MKSLLTAFVLLLASFSTFAYNPQFDTIVTFGDSLSDNGNLYRYFMHYLPASPPYFDGRFSEGPVWIEYLYNQYFPSSYTIGMQDYAVGGAGAILSYKENLPFTLAVEIADYFHWNTYGHKDTTLYSIWIGSNNYVNEPSNVDSLTTEVVDAIGLSLEKLIAGGGDKFLLINLPDLARLPIAKDSPNQSLLTRLTLEHNQKLTNKISELRNKYPSVLFIEFDAYQFFNQSIMSSTDFGIDNVTDACYLGSYSGWLLAATPNDAKLHTQLLSTTPALTAEQWEMIKNNPQLHEAAVSAYVQSQLPEGMRSAMSCQNYLFWDRVHPTTKVHELIAQQVKMMIDNAGLHAFWQTDTLQQPKVAYSTGWINGRRSQ